MHLTLSRSGRRQADLYSQLEAAIRDGRLREGDALPSTRDLASKLGVSRGTVLRAYEQLRAEGFVEGRHGAGTFVCSGVARAPRRAPASSPLAPRPFFRDLPPFEGDGPRAPYDFRVGAPDPELFPWDEWRPLVARQLHARRHAGGYMAPEGDPAARAAIARHLGLSRAVRAGADDVLVTSGAQQAFDLIARTLLAPGDRVAVEEPGYPQARRAFAAAGARIAHVGVDGEGLCVAQLPDDARLVYVTPSHQFPLGVPMSIARRLALLAWATRRGAAIVEDDYDSEFRYDGRPLDPLQSLDRDGRVLYVGTFSKVLVPSLRLGFVVAPASLAASLRAAKAVADAHGSPEAQRALASFIDDGRFGRHVRRLSRVYRERRERLAAEVARELGEEVTLLPAVAGLHQCVLFRDAAVDAAAIARRAREAGVIVQPLAPYYATRPRAGTGDARAGLCLGYGMIDAERIDEGIRRLAAALRPSPVTSPSSGKSWARGTSRRGSSRRAARRAVR